MAPDSPASRNASWFSTFLLIEKTESICIAFRLMKLRPAFFLPPLEWRRFSRKQVALVASLVESEKFALHHLIHTGTLVGFSVASVKCEKKNIFTSLIRAALMAPWRVLALVARRTSQTCTLCLCTAAFWCLHAAVSHRALRATCCTNGEHQGSHGSILARSMHWLEK